jgi:hypothetical protein
VAAGAEPVGKLPREHRKGPPKPQAPRDDAAALQALLDMPEPVREDAARKPRKPHANDAAPGDKAKWKKPRRSGMKPKAAGDKRKPR